jgi:hypothetical protein
VSTRAARPILVKLAEPEIERAFSEGVRIASGTYLAYCRGARVYRDPGFQRWTCLLRFDVLTNGGEFMAAVPMWMNLGRAQKASVSRRSIYLAEWVKANGGPPTRADRLSPRVFTRRMARVDVADTRGPIPYSVVRRILSWETVLPSQAVNKSPIKEGIR